MYRWEKFVDKAEEVSADIIRNVNINDYDDGWDEDCY